MDTSTLLSNAGRVAIGVRNQEQKLRDARLEQLKVEEANRAAREYKRAAEEEAVGLSVPTAFPSVPGKREVLPGMPTRLEAPPPAPSRPAVNVPPSQNPTTNIGKPTEAPPETKPQMTQAEFLAMSPEQRKAHLQFINDRRGVKALGYSLGTVPVTGFDMVVRNPVRGWAMGAEMLANSRFGRAVGLSEPGKPRDFVDETKTTPWGEQMIQGVVDNMTPYTEETYLDTLPATNSKGRRGGSYAARKRNAAGGLEVPPGAPLGAEGFESEKAAQRYTQLANSLPNALQSEGTQQLISRAQALDVDPAAAITIFGIETSYGANGSTSGKGAKGGMQVTDETFEGMKRWFADPNNGNVTPAQRAAAAALVRGNPQSEIDAGLLRIKYNELVGVPKPLWGAAYQAPAEQVRDKGAPINASDGHFTNGEYNSVFVNLYNRVVDTIGGMAPVATAQADTLPQPVATLAANDGPVLRDAVARGAAPQAQSPSRFYLANPTAVSSDMQVLMQQREQIARMANLQLRLQSAQGYERAMALKAQLTQIDQNLAYLGGIQGVRDLREGNDPRRLGQALSYLRGQQIEFQPRTDGTYDFILNGQVAMQGVPASKIEDDASSLFDQSYREFKRDMAGKEHEALIKERQDRAKELAQMIREVTVENVKGGINAQMEVLKSRLKGWEVSGPDSNGMYVFTLGREAYFFDPAGETITMGDSTILTRGAKPISGLNVPPVGVK